MKPGIFNDITIEDYHADKEWFSSTGLKKAKRSLKLFKMFVDGRLPDEYKAHFDMGNAFELSLLDPDQFNEKVAVEDEIMDQIILKNPDSKVPRSTTMYKDWFADQKAKGRYVVSMEDFAIITEMLASCKQDAVIQKLIQNIEYNYSLFWIDEETGLQLKTRPDICKSKKNIVVNLKTAIDGSPETFFKNCANMDYPFQACIEMDGVVKTGMMPKVDNYFWLVCEKTPPYSATLYEFMPEDIAYCMDEYRYTLGMVARAKEANLWPSYSQRASNMYGIIDVKIPMWYRNYGL